MFLGQQSNQVATRVSSPVSPPHVIPESNIANAELVWVPHDQDYTKSVEHGWLFEEYADIYPDTKGCDVDSISCRPSRDEFRWSALHRSETDILPSSSGWGQREEKENCFVDDSALADSEEVNPDVDLLELCEQLHIKAQVRNIDEFSHLFVNGVRLCKLVEQVTNALLLECSFSLKRRLLGSTTFVQPLQRYSIIDRCPMNTCGTSMRLNVAIQLF